MIDRIRQALAARRRARALRQFRRFLAHFKIDTEGLEEAQLLGALDYAIWSAKAHAKMEPRYTIEPMPGAAMRETERCAARAFRRFVEGARE